MTAARHVLPVMPVPARGYALFALGFRPFYLVASVFEITGVNRPVRMAPPALARGVAALSEGAARARGKTSSMCRARMRTILQFGPRTRRCCIVPTAWSRYRR